MSSPIVSHRELAAFTCHHDGPRLVGGWLAVVLWRSKGGGGCCARSHAHSSADGVIMGLARTHRRCVWYNYIQQGRTDAYI